MKAANKVLSVAGAAVGVAAAGTALRVAQRRAVIAKRGAGDETEFKSLRSAPITVVADDGVPLHVEVDEYVGTGRRRATKTPELTVQLESSPHAGAIAQFVDWLKSEVELAAKPVANAPIRLVPRKKSGRKN